MADAGLVLRQTMTDIASAIRTKGGASGNLRPSQMAQAILSISGGGGGGGGGEYQMVVASLDDTLALTPNENVNVPNAYVQCDGTHYLTLPYTADADYDVICAFDAVEYQNLRAPVGQTGEFVRAPMTLIPSQNNWWAFNGSAAVSFTGAFTGKQTVALNHTGVAYLGGVAKISSVTGRTSSDIRLVVGSRPYDYAPAFNGKIYYYAIKSISTGDLICELVPFSLFRNNTLISSGLYDRVNNICYSITGWAVTGLTPSSGGGGGTKYGVPVDFFLGDPNANGVLQKPSVDTVAIDLGAAVVDIAQEVLANKFQGSTGIKSFTGPALTKITGYRACYYMCQGCTGLTSVSFPELVNIGRAGLCHAFDGCTALTSASFPKVKRVSDLWGLQSAFAGCNNLTAIDFSLLESVAEEGLGNAFNNCTRLASISFLALTSVGVKGFSYAFQYAPIANVCFPSIQSLPNSRTFEFAFNENNALQEVSFPNLESIGADRTFDNAFSKGNSTGALRALFPKLKTITSYAGFYHAFWGRKGLSEIDFSVLETVNAGEVFDEAFRYCNALTSVSFPALVSAAGQNCFRVAFQNCTGLTQISFPLLETVNGAGSFRGLLFGCTALTAISLPSLRTITGNEAFYEFASGATSITSATFPSLTTVDGTNALFRLFYGCTRLVSLSFPALASIKGSNVMGGMLNGGTPLTSISFPALTTVATADALSNAFGGSSLTEAHFRADAKTLIEGLTNYSANFGRGAGNMTIYFDL